MKKKSLFGEATHEDIIIPVEYDKEVNLFKLCVPEKSWEEFSRTISEHSDIKFYIVKV